MASLEMATEGGQYLWRFGETGGSDSDLNSNRVSWQRQGARVGCPMLRLGESDFEWLLANCETAGKLTFPSFQSDSSTSIHFGSVKFIIKFR